MKKQRDPANQHLSQLSVDVSQHYCTSLFTQKYKHMHIMLDHWVRSVLAVKKIFASQSLNICQINFIACSQFSIVNYKFSDLLICRFVLKPL